jgi:L-asparaginase/Glu-tRNA(Gln) amidotransferase subunit D
VTLVAVLLTGGTIGQREASAGSVPDQDATVRFVAGLAPAGVRVRAVPVMQRNSPDVRPADWAALATAAARELAAGASGVVVLHGTDTLAYTAAALDLALGAGCPPVVVTGSMLPADTPGSDAAGNLSAALLVAASGHPGVCVVFGTGAGRAAVFDPRRVLKVRTLDAGAFQPLRGHAWGFVLDGVVTRAAPGPVRAPRSECPPTARARFAEDVDLVKVTPLTGATRLARLLTGLHGVVIEGYGAGHVAADQLDVLASFAGPVVMATQVLTDEERLGSYASDQALLDLPHLIPAGATTSVAALVTLSWALGEGRDPAATLGSREPIR